MPELTFNQEKLNDKDLNDLFEGDEQTLSLDESGVEHEYEDCPNITGKITNVTIPMAKAIALADKHRCPACEQRWEAEERYWNSAR